MCLCVHQRKYYSIYIQRSLMSRQGDIKISSRRGSNLGEFDFQVVQDEVAQKSSKRKTSYHKYSGEDRFKIGKYTSENRATAAVGNSKVHILI